LVITRASSLPLWTAKVCCGFCDRPHPSPRFLLSGGPRGNERTASRSLSSNSKAIDGGSGALRVRQSRRGTARARHVRAWACGREVVAQVRNNTFHNSNHKRVTKNGAPEIGQRKHGGRAKECAERSSCLGRHGGGALTAPPVFGFCLLVCACVCVCLCVCVWICLFDYIDCCV
jgi:hypothetical protein